MAIPSVGRPRRPGRKQKTATLLAQIIVREIHRRGLKPGDKLISEQKMVERYGVARGSLRETLRFLELQGVLRIKSGPGGGPVIETPNAQHLGSTLALLLQFAGAPFRSIVETRLAIEPGMAALAAGRATKPDLAGLRACLDSMRNHTGDSKLFHDENRRFHDLVAFASGNPVFRFLLPAFHWISDGSGMVFSHSERRSIVRALRQIYRAIEGGDAARASASMEQLLKRSLDYLNRTYPRVMSKPLTWADPGL